MSTNNIDSNYCKEVAQECRTSSCGAITQVSEQADDNVCASCGIAEVDNVKLKKCASRQFDDEDEEEIEYHSCEINWLDPEPDREDDDYKAYVEELKSIQEEITVYRGYHQPPTEEEYRRLCREYAHNN